jgi:hypothetical protein
MIAEDAMIAEDKAPPFFLVSHELPLDNGLHAYEHFDAPDVHAARTD